MSKSKQGPMDRNDPIFAKTGGRCWYCGCYLWHSWHHDHQLPSSRGGCNEPENLVPACKECNGAKCDKTVEEYRQHILDQEAKRVDYLFDALDKVAGKAETHGWNLREQINACMEAIGVLRRAVGLSHVPFHGEGVKPNEPKQG
jgi:hypothetical protein